MSERTNHRQRTLRPFETGVANPPSPRGLTRNRHANTIRLLGSLLASCAVAAPAGAVAQSLWTATASGNWGDPANWAGGVPSITGAAILSNAPSKVITVNLATPLASRAARRMDLSGPAGSSNTLRLDRLGAAPFQLANSLNLEAGSRLEILDSFLQLDGSEGGSLNQFAGELVLVSGGLATTNIAMPAINGLPGIRIGRSGMGRATILGGELRAFDELSVGDLAGGLGTLTLSNGLVRVGGTLNLGNNPGSMGLLEVFGGTLIATNASARIGDDGDGSLTQFGGLVQLDGASVARGPGSAGRLVLRGGALQPGSVSLGRFPTAQGILEVSDGTLDMSSKTLYVGREGSGTAIFSNGAAFVESLLIAASNTASGVLRLQGGSLTCGQLLADRPSAQLRFDAGTLVVTQATTVANGAPFTVGDGTQFATLQLDGGTHRFAHGLVISSHATLRGSGTVVGEITVLPGGVNQLGVLESPVVLSPAFVNGRLHFSFPSAAGRLYDVLAATSLDAPAWQWQATLTGTGAPLTYTSTPPATPKFYRVWIH